MSPSPPATLHSLPPEIVLRILRLFLDPQSLARVAQTSTRLYELARSDLLWKEVVRGLVDSHLDRSAIAFGSHLAHLAPSGPAPPTTWFDTAKFLLPHARHLGYFASSIPFTSRIIRVAIVDTSTSSAAPNTSSKSSSTPPAYAIHAAQLRPFNRYSVTSPPPAHLLPFGANLEITLDAYNISRIENPLHPDAGISTDVLSPRYDFSASMIDITPSAGPVLSHTISSAPRRPTRVRAPQLGLSLESAVQHVHDGGRSRTSLDLDRGGAGPNAELSREALLALFSGRLPRRSWPTLELVGIEQEPEPLELEAESLEHTRRGRSRPNEVFSRLRLNESGAFRGVEDWISQRGTRADPARIVERETTGSDSGVRRERQDDEAFVTGFRLRAKRRKISPATCPLPTPPATNTPEREFAYAEPERDRRRGVGRDGGIAVLWNGSEEDPDTNRPVTILRAGDPEQGGVVLNIDGDREPPSTHSPVANEASAASSDAFADAIDAASEAFFPIKPPATPIRWDCDPTWVGEGQDVTATSLEGMWVGTYGSHGLEFVHLSTRISPPRPSSRPPTPAADGVAPGPTEPEPPNRILTATKLTGDTNVPSGETTWIAFLDPEPSLSGPEVPDALGGQRGGNSNSSTTTSAIPSISRDQWTRMNRFDPNRSNAANAAVGGGTGTGTRTTARTLFSTRDWLEGTTNGVGQIALSGFLQPGWTSARVRFVRTKTTLRRNRVTGHVRQFESCDALDAAAAGRGAANDVSERGHDEDDENEWETKIVESVEEIQLRWAELNKIAVFKRVRI